MVYYDYFSKLASRKDNGIKRIEDWKALWGDDLSLPINQAYTPYAIQNVNRYSSIAYFFNNHPLRKLTLEQEDDKCQMVNPPTYDIQEAFDKSLSQWTLEKQDNDNYIKKQDKWNEIVKLVKASLSPRFIYATTFPNKIHIDGQCSKGEVIELGKYDSGTQEITLYANAIREAARDCGISFILLTTKVLLHELGHYIMDGGVDVDEDGKTAEESCSNLITLICFEQLLKDNKINKADYDAIVQFMLNQPEEYQLGPELMENAPWEWLKWKIFKQSYDGYAHRMPTGDCIMSVDDKSRYSKLQEKMLNQNNNKR